MKIQLFMSLAKFTFESVSKKDTFNSERADDVEGFAGALPAKIKGEPNERPPPGDTGL